MKQIERHNKEAAMHYKKYEMHKKKMDKLFKTLNDTSKLDELIEKDLEKKRKQIKANNLENQDNKTKNSAHKDIFGRTSIQAGCCNAHYNTL